VVHKAIYSNDANFKIEKENTKMSNLTMAQKVHIAVGVAAALVWIGLLIASRFVADGAGFLSTFADVTTLAKTTTVGAVSIATAIGNFTGQAADQPTALPPKE
jgi:hypothetical protein